MSKSVYYFRRYRQSQDCATIPEEWNRTEDEQNGGGTEWSTVVLDDKISMKIEVSGASVFPLS